MTAGPLNSSESVTVSAPSRPGNRPPTEQTRPRIEAFLARVASDTGAPGIALAASVDGRRFSASAGRVTRSGPALTAEHRFHIGCANKLLIAVVALELSTSGQLDLTAPIGEYLPELRSCAHGRAVRVMHLLSHTSGYRGTSIFDPDILELSWDGLVDMLRAAPRLFAPGTVFSYEHTESVLLGRIIERVTGRDPLDLVRESLLDPLGIAPGQLEAYRRDPLYAGQHELVPSGRFVAARELRPLPPLWRAAFSNHTLSPSDLVRITERFLPSPTGPIDRNGTGEMTGASGTDADDAKPAAALVSTTACELLTRRAVRLPSAAGGPLRERLPVAFGHGAAELRGGARGHNGLTHGQCLAVRFDARSRTTVAIALNAMLPHLRDHVLDAVCAELTGRGQAEAPVFLQLDPARLKGRYIGPGRGISIVELRRDGCLNVEIAPDGAAGGISVAVRIESDGRLEVESPIPQLSLAFFEAPAGGGIGMMVGLSAYKQVEGGKSAHR